MQSYRSDKHIARCSIFNPVKKIEIRDEKRKVMLTTMLLELQYKLLDLAASIQSFIVF